MFCLDEKVVYPGHGVSKVSRLVKKIVAGNEVTFYELAFLSKDATILVPMHNAESIGIRPLSSNQYIQDMFKILATPVRQLNHYEFTASNWNKRNKEYQNKLRTGSLKDLIEIYRDLRNISSQKELSFGEKSLLAQTESLLVEEISLVQQKGPEKILEQLRLTCSVPLCPTSHSNIAEEIVY